MRKLSSLFFAGLLGLSLAGLSACADQGPLGPRNANTRILANQTREADPLDKVFETVDTLDRETLHGQGVDRNDPFARTPQLGLPLPR